MHYYHNQRLKSIHYLKFFFIAQAPLVHHSPVQFFFSKMLTLAPGGKQWTVKIAFFWGFWRSSKILKQACNFFYASDSSKLMRWYYLWFSPHTYTDLVVRSSRLWHTFSKCGVSRGSDLFHLLPNQDSMLYVFKKNSINLRNIELLENHEGTTRSYISFLRHLFRHRGILYVVLLIYIFR